MIFWLPRKGSAYRGTSLRSLPPSTLTFVLVVCQGPRRRHPQVHGAALALSSPAVRRPLLLGTMARRRLLGLGVPSQALCGGLLPRALDLPRLLQPRRPRPLTRRPSTQLQGHGLKRRRSSTFGASCAPTLSLSKTPKTFVGSVATIAGATVVGKGSHKAHAAGEVVPPGWQSTWIR